MYACQDALQQFVVGLFQRIPVGLKLFGLEVAAENPEKLLAVEAGIVFRRAEVTVKPFKRVLP